MHFTINTSLFFLHNENQLSWELYTVSNVFSWFWGEIWPADVPDQLSHTHTHTSIHTHNSSRFASVQQISAWFWSSCGLISSFLQCHTHFFFPACSLGFMALSSCNHNLQPSLINSWGRSMIKALYPKLTCCILLAWLLMKRKSFGE